MPDAGSGPSARVPQQQPPRLGDDGRSWDAGLSAGVVFNTFDLLVEVSTVTPTYLERPVLDADQRRGLCGVVALAQPRHTPGNLAIGGFELGPDARGRAVMGLRGGHCTRTQNQRESAKDRSHGPCQRLRHDSAPYGQDR